MPVRIAKVAMIIFTVCAILIVALLSIPLIINYYQAKYPEKILEMTANIDRNTLYSYDIATVHINYIKYKDMIGEVCVLLSDGYDYPLLKFTGNLPKGKGIRSILVPIPDFIPSGIYHIHVIATYRWRDIENQIQVVQINTETQKFNLVQKRH